MPYIVHFHARNYPGCLHVAFDSPNYKIGRTPNIKAANFIELAKEIPTEQEATDLMEYILLNPIVAYADVRIMDFANTELPPILRPK